MCPCLRHLFAAHKFSCIPVELHPTTLCGMSLIIHANHTCFLHTARYFQDGVCVGGCFTTMDTVQKWTFKISYFRECKRHTTFSSAVCARNYMTAPHQRCGYVILFITQITRQICHYEHIIREFTISWKPRSQLNQHFLLTDGQFPSFNTMSSGSRDVTLS